MPVEVLVPVLVLLPAMGPILVPAPLVSMLLLLVLAPETLVSIHPLLSTFMLLLLVPSPLLLVLAPAPPRAPVPNAAAGGLSRSPRGGPARCCRSR